MKTTMDSVIKFRSPSLSAAIFSCLKHAGIILFLLFAIITSARAADNGGFLFLTFNGEGKMGEQVYFGLSRDGRNWTALNDAQPVLLSTVGTKGIRDPYLLRAENGTFYILATDLCMYQLRDWQAARRTGNRAIVIWESKDLVKWSEPRLAQIAPPGVGCTWAPEAVYDASSQRYLVYWAAAVPETNYQKFRIWAAWTKDFRSFEEPFIYIERPTDRVFDTDIVHADDGKYYRFSKEGRFIKMEASDRLADGWNAVAGFTLGQIAGVEGPACFKLKAAQDGKSATWCLLLDANTKDGYEPFVTDNLAGGKFEPLKDYHFAFRFRHGSVVPVSEDEYQRLQKYYEKPKTSAENASPATEPPKPIAEPPRATAENSKPIAP